MLLANYRNYLLGERGVSSGTVTHYLRCARVFLGSLPGQLEVALAELSAAQVSGYVLAWAKRRHGRAADLVTLPALRSLLRYLHVAGLIGAPLAEAVPAGGGYPRPALPRAVSAGQIRVHGDGRPCLRPRRGVPVRAARAAPRGGV